MLLKSLIFFFAVFEHGLAVDGGYTLTIPLLACWRGDIHWQRWEGTFLAWRVGNIGKQISGSLIHCGKPRFLFALFTRKWPAGRAFEG